MHVNLLAFLVRVERVLVQALKPERLAGFTRHVIALELQRELHGRVVRGRRVLAHRTRLRVVMRRRQVEVTKVLRGVLADSQVTHRHGRASTRGSHALLHLHEPFRVGIRGFGVVVRVRAARSLVVGRQVLLIRRDVAVLDSISFAIRPLQLAFLGNLSLERLGAFVPIDDPAVVLGVVAVVPVALTVESERDAVL